MRLTSLGTQKRDVAPVRPVRLGHRRGNPFAERATYLLAVAAIAASYLLPELANRLLVLITELRH